MRVLLLVPVLLLIHQLSFGQISYNVIQTRFNVIKMIIQPEIIQLPDSVIVFPLTGLTNIVHVPGSMICAPYTEIELWIIDSKGKIIYNNVIVTQSNNGCRPLEADYCRYMKLQSNYARHQHHFIDGLALK